MSEGAAKKEEKPRKFQAIRGTRDLLPPETALWNRVEQTAHEVFAKYGYGEIRLPIFEEYGLFQRAIGQETDIVGKEMYLVKEDYENREAAELGFIQDQVRFLTVSLGQPNTIQAFRDLMGEFVGKYQSSAQRGLLPSSEAGSSLFAVIVRQLSDVDRMLDAFHSAPGTPELENLRFLLEDRINSTKALVGMLRFWPVEALRPEATAGVCRAYIENNMQQLPQPVKLYYMGPMFRRERPQKGRYRQFYQIGAEVLDHTRLVEKISADVKKELKKDAAIDAEVIEMLMTFFDKVGLHGTTLYINSIGHNAPNCRRGYVEKLRAALTKIKDKLGADSQRRIETNPLRVLDSKLQSEQSYIEKLPHIADYLCDECKTQYTAVKHELDLRGVKYQENWRLVRGLDYYMRTTFEITAPGLGSQDAVCGGGRYDRLVELLGGPPTKGIGFAIGEDRLILSLLETGHSPLATRHSPLLYIAWMGEKAYATAIRAAKNLRNAGFSVELPPVEQKFGKALGQADKLGAKFALILGDNEVSEGLWTLKTLADGSQQKLTEPQLLEFLKKL